MSFTLLLVDYERELNSFSYDSGFNLYEHAIFDQEFIDYLENNDILIYKKKESYKPFYFTNDENMSKTTEISGTSNNVYSYLLSNTNSGTYYLSFANSDVTFTEFQEFITTNYEVDILFFEYEEPAKQSMIIPIVAVISLIFITLYITKDLIVKNRNQIKILTLSGKSYFEIWRLLSKELVAPSLISVFLFSLVFLFFSHYFSYFLIFSISLIILLLLISIGILIFLFIKKAFKKSPRTNKFVYIINIVIILFFITTGVSAFITLYNDLQSIITLKSNDEFYSDFYYVEGQIGTEPVITSEEYGKNGEDDAYQKALFEMGSITFNQSSENSSVISINENYLAYYDYDELIRYDYIVPLERKDEFLAYGSVNNENTFYYENDIEIENFNYRNKHKIKNPVFVVDHQQTAGGSSFILPATMPIDDYQQVIDEYYIDSTEEQGVVLSTYDEVLQKQINKFIGRIDNFILFFIIYLMLIFIITTYIISSFYQRNNEEINVKRLHGFKYTQPLTQNFIIMNLVIVIICNIINAALISYITLGFLNILFYLCYKKVEKASRGKHA